MTQQKGKAYRSKEETLKDVFDKNIPGWYPPSYRMMPSILEAIEIYATQEKDRHEGWTDEDMQKSYWAGFYEHESNPDGDQSNKDFGYWLTGYTMSKQNQGLVPMNPTPSPEEPSGVEEAGRKFVNEVLKWPIDCEGRQMLDAYIAGAKWQASAIANNSPVNVQDSEQQEWPSEEQINAQIDKSGADITSKVAHECGFMDAIQWLKSILK